LEIKFNFIVKNGIFIGEYKGKLSNGITTIIGPSGCGKTTFLRCFSGDLTPFNGDIKLGEKILFSKTNRIDVPINKRNVSTVYQNHLLFPHMKVKNNIEYGYKIKNRPLRINTSEILHILKIEHLLNKFPHQLSGGEAQRVGLARAIFSNPDILLMDEPFTSLDYDTKGPILLYLKQLQKKLNIPFFFVTHSLEEMYYMSDQVILMNKGQIISVGNPDTIILNKIDGISNKISNYIHGEILSISDEKIAQIKIGNIELFAPVKLAQVGSNILVHFFANDVIISTSNMSNVSARNLIKGELIAYRYIDTSCLLTLLVQDIEIYVEITKFSMEKLSITIGNDLYMIIKSSSCNVVEY
tara:strand:+ start:27130 stop:28194 length:1065 start_codon:yes stop_codon:yes gene_type:complete